MQFVVTRVRGIARIKSSSALVLLSATLPLILACAPQRTTFTIPSRATPSTSIPLTACTTNDLNVRTTPSSREGILNVNPLTEVQLQNLALLIQSFKANENELTLGFYRDTENNSPMTKKLQKRRESVIWTNETMARVKTENKDTGEVLASRCIKKNEASVWEDMAQALVAEDEHALSLSLSSAIEVYSESLKRKDPLANQEVTVDVQTLEFVELDTYKTSVFKFVLELRFSEIPFEKPLVISALIAPELPRPFNVLRVSWQLNRQRQRLFDIQAFGQL